MKKNQILKNTPLKVLILEDSLLDLELMSEHLSEAGYKLDVTHVEVEKGFRAALQKETFDMILSDYKLPGFDAFGALEISQKLCPETPFICVSGSIGEEKAVEILKQGAADYILKDRIKRLPYAIKRALDEVKENQALKKAKERLVLLNRAVEASSVSVVITDAEGKINYVNPYFTKVTGYSLEEVLGESPRIFKSENKEQAFYQDLWSTLLSGKEWGGEFRNVKKNGEAFWEKAVISPIVDHNTGQITHFVAIKEDITELLKKEDELKQSLKEKEIMLAEIHHRVKNNLAVVSAMLELQSFDEKNPEVQERLLDSTSRIKTIANIHESLYQCESFSRVNFSENIQTLVYKIDEIFNCENRIKINLSLDKVQLNINQAVPCSLIVNEVIVNAFKHAFIKENEGTIYFHLSEHDNNVEVTITDNGVGLPDDFMQKSQSSGTMIIQLLTEQLNGRSLYKRIESGTEFSLTFEKTDAKGGSSALL